MKELYFRSLPDDNWKKECGDLVVMRLGAAYHVGVIYVVTSTMVGVRWYSECIDRRSCVPHDDVRKYPHADGHWLRVAERNLVKEDDDAGTDAEEK